MVVDALVSFLALAPPPTSDTITNAVRGEISLTWTADEVGCPSADEVIDDALAAVGQAPPAGLVVTASGVIEPDGDALALVLTVRSPHGEGTRRVVAPQCRSLGRIAALVIALTIDPNATMPEEPPDPDPLPEPTPEPDPTPLPDPPEPSEPIAAPTPTPVDKLTPTPNSKRRAPSPLHGSLSITAGAGIFPLPRPTAAFELALALAGTQWRAELGGTYWAPSERTSQRNREIGGSFQLVGATARGCWVPRWQQLELPLCAVMTAAAMLGRGTGDLVSTQGAASPFVAFGGGPTLAWRPRRGGGRIALLLRVEGLAALTRPAFQTQPSPVVIWQARAGALQALGGVEVRFASRRDG